jgi:hypothetical protein
MVRTDQRDIAGVIAEYDGLIRLDPKIPLGFDGRCWARALAGVDLDAALADCNRAIELSRYDAIAYQDRAIVWFKRGELSKVIFDASLRSISLKTASARFICAAWLGSPRDKSIKVRPT